MPALMAQCGVLKGTALIVALLASFSLFWEQLASLEGSTQRPITTSGAGSSGRGGSGGGWGGVFGLGGGGGRSKKPTGWGVCPNVPTFLPQLRQEAVWRTRAPRVYPAITLVTQGSFDRLHLLSKSCRSWKGMVAAAIYAPLVNGEVVLPGLKPTTVEKVLSKLELMHRKFERRGQCSLDMVLYTEARADDRESILYPANALRNRALILAQTESVLLADLDFMVSKGVSDPRKYPRFSKAVNKRKVVVLPAFEATTGPDWLKGQNYTFQAIQGGKPMVQQMWAEEKLEQFQGSKWITGHNATDYARWFTADTMYYVKWEEGYEPYVVAPRVGIPWYDERFRGYHKNKAMHLRHLRRLNYKFVVHPTAFVMHMPHNRTRQEEVTREYGLRELNFAIAAEMKVEMRAGKYTPVTTFSCMTQDDSASYGKITSRQTTRLDRLRRSMFDDVTAARSDERR